MTKMIVSADVHGSTNTWLTLKELPIEAQSLLGQYETCIFQLGYGQTRDLGKGKALPVTWNGTAPGGGVKPVCPALPDSLFL